MCPKMPRRQSLPNLAKADDFREPDRKLCVSRRMTAKILVVEDDLLNEVVKRHRRSVTTENRLPALCAIEPSDCATIDHLMTKYSFYEHSQSMEVPAFIPEEAELRQDIEELKGWRIDFGGRCKAALG